MKQTLDNVIVVKVDEVSDQIGGVYIPDSVKDQNQKDSRIGKVTMIGPGHRLDSGEVVAMVIQVGATVWFGKYVGCEVTLDGEKFYALPENEVLVYENPEIA